MTTGGEDRPRTIDFRARPNTGPFRSWLELPGPQTLFAKLGRPVPPLQTLGEFVAEMDRNGIELVVCQGRDVETTIGWKVSNDHVAELVEAADGRLIGMAGIDPLKRHGGAEVERAVLELGLSGAMVEPYAAKVYANDRSLYPVYHACQRLQVPVVVTLGPLPIPGAKLDHGSPATIDDVANDFPDLTIVCAHGGWPWVDEMVAIAYRHPHVYFETSIYHFLPGQDACVRAANELVGDKLLYASGFPFAPLAEVHRYAALPFEAEVRNAVLFGNAERLLARIQRRAPVQ
jgi:uncharacterized protein